MARDSVGVENTFSPDHEGVLVDHIQAARRDADAIIINPAAYSFTSIAVLDAIRIFEGPVFEEQQRMYALRRPLWKHAAHSR